MGALEGRVAIITGAGRGLGREHALLFAREGAKVVVNDLGVDLRGQGSERELAQAVVDEIVAEGGEAVVSTEDVADFDDAKRLVDRSIETFGRLDVLVNNAGVLRDRMIVNMTEEEWDSAVALNLRGHFCPTRHAAAYWRAQAKAGEAVKAALVHTSSTSGVLGNPGQTNYGAAKAGVAMFSTICAMELGRYGVRSNAITPTARTRLTESTPGLEEMIKAPDDPDAFDRNDPANVSPVVAYLATADCPFTGETFFVYGDVMARYQSHMIAERIEAGGRRWTVARLVEEAPKLEPAGERRGGPNEFTYAQ